MKTRGQMTHDVLLWSSFRLPRCAFMVLNEHSNLIYEVILSLLQIKFSGVNLNGFDSANCVMDGLWIDRPWFSYLDQVID